MPPAAEAPPAVELEPWARVADPHWDGRGAGRLLRAAWRANANSAWTRAYARHWLAECPADLPVVYYGVPVDGAGERGGAGPLPPWPYVLCAARLAEYKGQDVLAMAFARVLDHPAAAGLHLVLCGQDESAGRLQRFAASLGIAGRVHALGRLPHRRVLELVRGCRLFVLPSRRDSLGGALIEAMAEGRPVVASRTGGIPELVRDGVDGLLVPPADPEALARAMELLLESPDRADALARSARRRSRRFSWSAALESYAESWRSHPEWREKGTVGFVVWDSCADQTALAYHGNVARGLAAAGQPFCAVLRRSAWTEPFREESAGAALYRLGLPPGRLLAPLSGLLSLLQLLWIARARRVRVWHFLLLRYRGLRVLTWFASLTGCRPVVTLA